MIFESGKFPTVCMLRFLNPVMVDSYAAFFNCMPVGRASHNDGPSIVLFIFVGWGRSILSVTWPTEVQQALDFSRLFGAQGSPTSGSL